MLTLRSGYQVEGKKEVQNNKHLPLWERCQRCKVSEVDLHRHRKTLLQSRVWNEAGRVSPVENTKK